MKTVQALAVLGTLAFAPLGKAVEFTSVQTEKSSIGFVVHEMGVPVNGTFKRFGIDVAFDPAKPASARAAIDLDVTSIDAGSAEANGEVVGKLWFDTPTYPKARFESTAVKSLGGNRYEVSGKMTIKGRTREVAAPFTFTPQGAEAAFDGSFELKRADFAIGEGEWADFGTVANEIQVKFHFLASARK
jgi:polyisoprenoid-binding protein YceI